MSYLQRLSSNATLFLKLFLPVFWTTITLAITLAVWLMPEHYFGGLPLESIRWAMLLILTAGIGTFLLLFWPLKRVEANGEFIYVSNYFKTARYSWTSEVAKLERRPFLWMEIGFLHLTGKGAFGSRIYFLASKRLLNAFEQAHPDVIK